MSLRPAEQLYQYRGLTLVTAPTSEPVSVAELRTHLRVDSTLLSDDEANDLIAEAREEIEQQTNVAMMLQTWKLTIDRWPGEREQWWDGVRQGSITELSGKPGWLEIPKWPLSSVDAVTVYDEASNSASVTIADTFDVDTRQLPGRLALKSGATWPIALRPTNAIEITAESGYADAASVPAPIKRAVKQLAAHLYANRGDDCDVGDAYHASGAASIMAKYKPARL